MITPARYCYFIGSVRRWPADAPGLPAWLRGKPPGGSAAGHGAFLGGEHIGRRLVGVVVDRCRLVLAARYAHRADPRKIISRSVWRAGMPCADDLVPVR